jgi:hypothetical protein
MKAVNERLLPALDGELDGSVTCQMRQNRQMSGTAAKNSRNDPENARPTGKS